MNKAVANFCLCLIFLIAIFAASVMSASLILGITTTGAVGLQMILLGHEGLTELDTGRLRMRVWGQQMPLNPPPRSQVTDCRVSISKKNLMHLINRRQSPLTPFL